MHVEPTDELKSAVESSWEIKADASAVKCVAQGGEDEERSWDDEDGDWRNVEKLSDLFTRMESEHELGVDFGVYIEDQDAVHVEEISDIFSALESANLSSQELEIVLQDDESTAVFDEEEDARVVDEYTDLFSSLEGVGDADDAENVDEMSALFTELESKEAAESTDAENVDEMSALFTELESKEAAASTDAENVDEMSALFSELEGVEADKSACDQDWIDSLEVGNAASLFADLEKTSATPPPAPGAKVDARIFVPTFAVRIEGKPSPAPTHSLLSVSSTMLAGPPRQCPPAVSSRAASVGRWLEKRKSRSQAARRPDPSISDTRRACAAKRQRVKGRFVAEKHSFVSITTLQQS